MPPLWSVATHSDTAGHETAVRTAEPSTSAVDQAFGPPVGLVDATTFPSPPVATQRVSDGHDTAHNEFGPSTLATVQALVPPVGSEDATMSP
jgi:hypothetical protein